MQTNGLLLAGLMVHLCYTPIRLRIYRDLQQTRRIYRTDQEPQVGDLLRKYT